MKIIRLLYWFWMLLANIILLIDVISYYKLMWNEDWFQLINRNMNVGFVHLLIVLPFTITTFYIINIINKKQQSN